MNESSGDFAAVEREITPKIRARLDEITSPGYTDPARADLTGVDWVLILGFLIVCAAGFTVWGY